MQPRSTATILREALTSLAIACFLVGSIVSLRMQAGENAYHANGGGIAVLCVHGPDGTALGETTPAAPADDNRHCQHDCALCGGSPPVLSTAMGAPAAPAFVVLLAAVPAYREAPPADPLTQTPPKRGPPLVA